MIKKPLFMETINFIKDRVHFEDKLCNLCEEEFDDFFMVLYGKPINMIIKLLAASFDYEDEIVEDWIYYFIYDLEFGTKWKSGDVTEMVKDPTTDIECEKDIRLSTPEELYDMIFEEACGGEAPTVNLG